MKKIKSTKTWILLYSIIVSSVATEHTTSHHNGPPRHGATSPSRKKSQNQEEPMEIQIPEQVMSMPCVSCISPDLNIFEIMNESKRTCRGKDLRCTFYLLANSKYYNIGSVVIDKELFNQLIEKYDNLWLTAKTIAPENIESYFEDDDRQQDYTRFNEYDHLYQSDISPVFTEDKDFFDINSYNSKYAENINDLDYYKEYKSRAKSHRNKHKHKENSIRFIDVEENPKKNGKYAELVPEYNKDHKYFEVFLPKDKHKGKSRTKFDDHDKLLENQRINHRYDTSLPYEMNQNKKSHHHRKTLKSKNRTNISADDVEELFKATEARDEDPHITSIMSSNTYLEKPQVSSDYGDKSNPNMQDESLNINHMNAVEISPENYKQILSYSPNIDNSDQGVNFSNDDLGNLIIENTTLKETSLPTINIEPVTVSPKALDPTTNNILAEIPDRTQNNDNVSDFDDININIDPSDQLSANVFNSKSNKTENISTGNKIANVSQDIKYLVNNNYRHIHELVDQATINDIHDNKTEEYTNLYNEHNFDETHDLSVHDDILKTSNVHLNEPVFPVMDSFEENRHNNSVYICAVTDFDPSDSNVKISDYIGSQKDIKPSRKHELDSSDISVKPIITKPSLHATPIMETDLPNTLIPDVNLYSTWPNLIRPSIHSLLHSDLSSTHLIEDVCESGTVIKPYMEADLPKNELKLALPILPCIEKGIYEEVIPEYFSPTEMKYDLYQNDESPILNNLITVESPCIVPPKDTISQVHLDLLRTPLSSEFDVNVEPIPQAFPPESTRTMPLDLSLIPCTSKMAPDARIYDKQDVLPTSSTRIPHFQSVQPYIEPTMSDQFQFLTTKNLNHESLSPKIYLDHYPSENAELFPLIPCQILRSDDSRPLIGPDETLLVNQVQPHQTPSLSNILRDIDIRNYLSTEELHEITKNKLQPDQILELFSKGTSPLKPKPYILSKNNQIINPSSPLMPSAYLPSFQPGLFQSGILPSLNRVPYSQIPFIAAPIVKPVLDTELYNNKPLNLDNDSILTTIKKFAQSTQSNPSRDEELLVFINKLPLDLKRLLRLEPYLTDLTDSNKPKEISKSLQYINTPYTNIENQPSQEILNLQPESFINPEYQNVLPSTLSVIPLQPQKTNSQQAIIVPTANEMFTELDKDTNSLFKPSLPTEYSQITPSVTDSSMNLNTLSSTANKEAKLIPASLLLNTNNEIESTNFYLDKPLQVSPVLCSNNELNIMSPKTQTTSLFAIPIDYASQPKQFDIFQSGKSIVSISPDTVSPPFYEDTESVIENFVETKLDNLLSNLKTNYYEEIQPAVENLIFETLAPNVAGTTVYDMSTFKPIPTQTIAPSISLPSEASTVSMPIIEIPYSSPTKQTLTSVSIPIPLSPTVRPSTPSPNIFGSNEYQQLPLQETVLSNLPNLIYSHPNQKPPLLSPIKECITPNTPFSTELSPYYTSLLPSNVNYIDINQLSSKPITQFDISEESLLPTVTNMRPCLGKHKLQSLQPIPQLQSICNVLPDSVPIMADTTPDTSILNPCDKPSMQYIPQIYKQRPSISIPQLLPLPPCTPVNYPNSVLSKLKSTIPMAVPQNEILITPTNILQPVLHPQFSFKPLPQYNKPVTPTLITEIPQSRQCTVLKPKDEVLTCIDQPFSNSIRPLLETANMQLINDPTLIPLTDTICPLHIPQTPLPIDYVQKIPYSAIDICPSLQLSSPLLDSNTVRNTNNFFNPDYFRNIPVATSIPFSSYPCVSKQRQFSLPKVQIQPAQPLIAKNVQILKPTSNVHWPNLTPIDLPTVTPLKSQFYTTPSRLETLQPISMPSLGNKLQQNTQVFNTYFPPILTQPIIPQPILDTTFKYKKRPDVSILDNYFPVETISPAPPTLLPSKITPLYYNNEPTKMTKTSILPNLAPVEYNQIYHNDIRPRGMSILPVTKHKSQSTLPIGTVLPYEEVSPVPSSLKYSTTSPLPVQANLLPNTVTQLQYKPSPVYTTTTSNEPPLTVFETYSNIPQYSTPASTGFISTKSALPSPMPSSIISNSPLITPWYVPQQLSNFKTFLKPINKNFLSILKPVSPELPFTTPYIEANSIKFNPPLISKPVSLPQLQTLQSQSYHSPILLSEKDLIPVTTISSESPQYTLKPLPNLKPIVLPTVTPIQSQFYTTPSRMETTQPISMPSISTQLHQNSQVPSKLVTTVSSLLSHAQLPVVPIVSEYNPLPAPINSKPFISSLLTDSLSPVNVKPMPQCITPKSPTTPILPLKSYTSLSSPTYVKPIAVTNYVPLSPVEPYSMEPLSNLATPSILPILPSVSMETRPILSSEVFVKPVSVTSSIPLLPTPTDSYRRQQELIRPLPLTSTQFLNYYLPIPAYAKPISIRPTISEGTSKACFQLQQIPTPPRLVEALPWPQAVMDKYLRPSFSSPVSQHQVSAPISSPVPPILTIPATPIYTPAILPSLTPLASTSTKPICQKYLLPEYTSPISPVNTKLPLSTACSPLTYIHPLLPMGSSAKVQKPPVELLKSFSSIPNGRQSYLDQILTVPITATKNFQGSNISIPPMSNLHANQYASTNNAVNKNSMDSIINTNPIEYLDMKEANMLFNEELLEEGNYESYPAARSVSSEPNLEAIPLTPILQPIVKPLQSSSNILPSTTKLFITPTSKLPVTPLPNISPVSPLTEELLKQYPYNLLPLTKKPVWSSLPYNLEPNRDLSKAPLERSSINYSSTSPINSNQLNNNMLPLEIPYTPCESAVNSPAISLQSYIELPSNEASPIENSPTYSRLSSNMTWLEAVPTQSSLTPVTNTYETPTESYSVLKDSSSPQIKRNIQSKGLNIIIPAQGINYYTQSNKGPTIKLPIYSQNYVVPTELVSSSTPIIEPDYSSVLPPNNTKPTPLLEQDLQTLQGNELFSLGTNSKYLKPVETVSYLETTLNDQSEILITPLSYPQPEIVSDYDEPMKRHPKLSVGLNRRQSYTPISFLPTNVPPELVQSYKTIKPHPKLLAVLDQYAVPSPRSLASSLETVSMQDSLPTQTLDPSSLQYTPSIPENGIPFSSGLLKPIIKNNLQHPPEICYQNIPETILQSPSEEFVETALKKTSKNINSEPYFTEIKPEYQLYSSSLVKTLKQPNYFKELPITEGEPISDFSDYEIQSPSSENLLRVSPSSSPLLKSQLLKNLLMNTKNSPHVSPYILKYPKNFPSKQSSLISNCKQFTPYLQETESLEPANKFKPSLAPLIPYTLQKSPSINKYQSLDSIISYNSQDTIQSSPNPCISKIIPTITPVKSPISSLESYKILSPGWKSSQPAIDASEWELATPIPDTTKISPQQFSSYSQYELLEPLPSPLQLTSAIDLPNYTEELALPITLSSTPPSSLTSSVLTLSDSELKELNNLPIIPLEYQPPTEISQSQSQYYPNLSVSPINVPIKSNTPLVPIPNSPITQTLGPQLHYETLPSPNILQYLPLLSSSNPQLKTLINKPIPAAPISTTAFTAPLSTNPKNWLPWPTYSQSTTLNPIPLEISPDKEKLQMSANEYMPNQVTPLVETLKEVSNLPEELKFSLLEEPLEFKPVKPVTTANGADVKYKELNSINITPYETYIPKTPITKTFSKTQPDIISNESNVIDAKYIDYQSIKPDKLNINQIPEMSQYVTINKTPANLIYPGTKKPRASNHFQYSKAPEISPISLSEYANSYPNNRLGKKPNIVHTPTTDYSNNYKTLPVNSRYTEIKNYYNNNHIEYIDSIPEFEATLLKPDEFKTTINKNIPIYNTENIMMSASLKPDIKHTTDFTEVPYPTTSTTPENVIKYEGYKTYYPSLKMQKQLPHILQYRNTSPNTPEKTKLNINNIQQDLELKKYIPVQNICDQKMEDEGIDKSILFNYINSKKDVINNLFNSNGECTISLGDIAINKKGPSDYKTVETKNPSIGLKVWKSNAKIVTAELKFKLKELSINNFMPVVKDLDEFDVEEIRRIVKEYINEKYGHHIEIREPYLNDNQYILLKDLDMNACHDKFNLLWPSEYV